MKSERNPPNQALEPTTLAVTTCAPSSTSRASRGRGSSLTLGKSIHVHLRFGRATSAPSKEKVAKLVSVYRDVRILVALPSNDFSWSSWHSQVNALAEIDALIAKLEAGESPSELHMDVLFAPTGPLQELSLSSGWAHEFLVIAERYDDAVGKA